MCTLHTHTRTAQTHMNDIKNMEMTMHFSPAKPDGPISECTWLWARGQRQTKAQWTWKKRFKPVDSVWLASWRAVKTSDRKWTNKMQMDFIKMVFANAKWKFFIYIFIRCGTAAAANVFFCCRRYLLVCLFNFIIGIHCDCLQQIFSNFIRPSLNNLRANSFFIDF